MKIRVAASVALFVFAPMLAFAQETETVNVVDANSTPVATLLVPRRGIQSSEIAVLINDNDLQSVDVANYYQQKRNIPNQNMVHLNSFPARSSGYEGTTSVPVAPSPSADIACVNPELIPRSDVMQSEQSKRRDDPHYCEVTANHAVA